MGQQVYFEDITEGQELPPLRKHPTRRQLVMWAGASEDFYEIHYDNDFARANKLDNVIVHGRLKAAFLGQLLTDWASPAGRLLKMTCRYRGTDPANQDMQMRGVVTSKRIEGRNHCVEVEIWSEQPDGTKTTAGTATVVLPSKSRP